MSKMKPQGWNQLSRQSKIAACMYPNLVSDEIREQARTIKYGARDDPLRMKASEVSRVSRVSRDTGWTVVNGKWVRR